MTLQVAFNNQIISNSVVFEYKARALPTLPSSQHDWLSLDGKNSILVTLLGIEGEELVCRCEKEGSGREGQEGVSELDKGGPAESSPWTMSISCRSACVWSLPCPILIQPLLGTDEVCEAGL